MFNKIKKNNEGFTIIEVLIVLAIVGLIMMIIFFAVPALQRNSRNTSIKNDVSSVLAGISDYSGSNNGALPTTIASAADGTVTISGAAGTNAVTTKVRAGTTVANGTTMPTATDTITVYLNRKCAGNAFAAAATNRAVAAGYLIETGSTTPTQCTES